MHERPAMEEQQARPEAPGEPRDASEAHQRSDPALRMSSSSDDGSAEHHEPDDAVGDDEAEIVAGPMVRPLGRPP